MFLGSQPWPPPRHWQYNFTNVVLSQCRSRQTKQNTRHTQGSMNARVRPQPTLDFFSIFSIYLNQSVEQNVKKVSVCSKKQKPFFKKLKSCQFWFAKESISESSFVLFNWKLFVQKLLTFYKVCLPWWYDFNFYEGKIIPLSRSLCQDSNYDNEAANYQLFGPCLKQYLRSLQRKARHIDTRHSVPCSANVNSEQLIVKGWVVLCQPLWGTWPSTKEACKNERWALL